MNINLIKDKLAVYKKFMENCEIRIRFLSGKM